jgi:hypothetical protein
MDTRRAARPIPLFLIALVAFFGALVALAVANGHGGLAHGSASGRAAPPAHAVDAAAVMSRKEVALRQDMRELWEDHITWTRLAVISLTTDAPDTEATVGRLLRNQTDIGGAVEPFYGEAAGDELARQLRLHILIAADLIAAARAGDAAALAEAQARWEQNADDIAAVLHSVNPRHWQLATMKSELRTHLELTTEEVVARLEGDWDRDVAAYDEIHRHALHFADLLSTGLVKQFPRRFR